MTNADIADDGTEFGVTEWKVLRISLEKSRRWDPLARNRQHSW
jgi:hypothetical protein